MPGEKHSRVRRRLAFLIATLLITLPASAQRIRAVRSFPDFSRILVISAHPDDESLLAPLLGQQCVESRQQCSLLVMTRGENGTCVRDGGCGSDLGAVRAAELAQSAALLNLRLRLLDFPDVMTGVTAQWDAHAGSHEALLSRIEGEIDERAPTAIITFDPAHGSTCHPAHEAIAALVAETRPRPPVYFLETRVQFEGTKLRLTRGLQFANTIVIFDAAQTWHYLVEVGRLHASQFTAAQIASLDDADQYRSVLLMPQSAGASARYDSPCP